MLTMWLDSALVACFENSLVYYIVCCLLIIVIARQTVRTLNDVTSTELVHTVVDRLSDKCHGSGAMPVNATESKGHVTVKNVSVQVNITQSSGTSSENVEDSSCTPGRPADRDAAVYCNGSATGSSHYVTSRSIDDIEAERQQQQQQQASLNITDVKHQVDRRCATTQTDDDATVSEPETVQLLQRQVERLRAELVTCRQQVEALRKTDQQLRDRLCDQVRSNFDKECSRFEDVNLGAENRPTLLIRRFNDIYSEDRQEVIDVLDQLPDIASCDELKDKLLFSIVVLCFRFADQSIRQMKETLASLMCVNEMKLSSNNSSSNTSTTTTTTTSNSSLDDVRNNKMAVERLADNVHSAVSDYLRKTAHLRDVTADVKVVCDQLWSTLYDYPQLKSCSELRHYITTCMRLAWSLTVQSPPYALIYHDCVGQNFDDERHTRHHTSSGRSTVVRSVVWPGLVEKTTDVCVCRAIVVT